MADDLQRALDKTKGVTGSDVVGFSVQKTRFFLQLLDAPKSYSGQSGKVLKVKTTEDGLEFDDTSDDITGNDTHVLFFDGANNPAGDAGFTYNKTTDIATIGGVLLTGLTASQIVATDASKNLQTLSTTTYPSLTELSYVKGVTSAIQTQLDSKFTTANAAALTKSDDTNVTLTLGGSPTTALLAATSLTLGWTGQLSVARGGTGNSSWTNNGILYASGTTTLTNSSILTFNGSTALTFQSNTDLTFTINNTSGARRFQMGTNQGGSVPYIGITYNTADATDSQWQMIVNSSHNYIISKPGESATFQIVNTSRRFDFYNRTDTASNQVFLIQGNDRATPANNDNAYISMHLDQSGGSSQEFARMLWIATDVSSSSKDAELWFYVQSNNTLTRKVDITNDGINLNTSTDNIRVSGSDPKRSISIDAGEMYPSTTSGCAGLAQTELTTNDVDILTLDFDQTTQEYAQFTFIMPDGWDAGTVTYKVVWTAASGTGTVAWELQGISYADSDALDASWGTAIQVTDTLITANDEHITSESSALTLAGGPVAGERVHFRISRNTGSDTLTADAKLIGVRIEWTRAQYND